MIESFAVAVSVGAPANVPARHPYAVSESARVLTQLGKERAALDRIREGEKLLQRQVETGYVSQCSWAYHVLGRARPQRGQRAEARRLGERAIDSAVRPPEEHGLTYRYLNGKHLAV